MSAPRTQRLPDLRRYVAVCTTCRHWQLDIRPGAISDLGGARDALWAIGLAHSEHIRDDCPGAGGRVNLDGRWVSPPKMSDGADASGTLEMNLLPKWWVSW